MLRFDKMTVKAQEALQSAQEIAGRHENQQIEPIHLLAALAAQTDGVGAFARYRARDWAFAAREWIRATAYGQAAERRAGARVR